MVANFIAVVDPKVAIPGKSAFKEINDKFGHSTGDQLLIEVGLRLNQSVREADTVARLGGDEFAVILSQIQDPIFSNKIAETILEKLGCPFVINSSELSITASLGVSVYPYDGADVETLLINSGDVPPDVEICLAGIAG